MSKWVSSNGCPLNGCCCPSGMLNVVDDLGFGKRQKLPKESVKLLEAHKAFAAALTQPIPPSTLGMFEYYFEHLVVAAYTVILIVAAQLGA